jgi:hypothetical protein
MILKIFFIALCLYFLYNLVFKFILPVVRTARRVKKGFREMKEKMEQGSGGYKEGQTQGQAKQGRMGDYIDFEEVKD